jgi:hypothetical protein
MTVRKPLLVLAFLALSCGPKQPSDAPLAQAQPTHSELCPKMCEHFRELKCEEGDPYYDNDKPGPADAPNSTCEDFCKEQQAKGVNINPSCAMQAPSCDLIEVYRQKTCD